MEKKMVDERNRRRSCCGDSSEDEGDWRRYYDYSTFHGVRDWCYAGNWFMRLLWTFTLTFAVGYTFYGCYAIIDEYLQHPLVVSYVQICDNLTEILTSAGKCFRISGADQQGDGFGYGMRVVIRLPHKLFNPGVNQLLNDGIAVKLAERNRGIDHDLTFIPSGVHAIMPLSATRYDFLNDPPRYMCDHDADPTYSSVWCFETCFTKEAEDECQCSLAASAVPRKPLICTTKRFFDCFAPVLFSANNSNMVDICKRKCPSPCSFWQYHKSVSYARFPAPKARFFVANDTE